MDMFEYVTILTSIILGLGITHLLHGVSRLIQHPGRDKVYWVHLLWVFWVFYVAIFFWWWEFKLGEVGTWSFHLYLFIVFFTVLIYLLCSFLFPSDLDDYEGYEDYFLSRRRWFFGGMIAYLSTELLDTWLKGPDHFASLGASYVIMVLGAIVLCIVAMVTKNRRFHGILAPFWVLAHLSWSIPQFQSIG